MKILTVKHLIEALNNENPNAVVAMDDGNRLTFMLDDGFLVPKVFLRKQIREQNNYYAEDELCDTEKELDFVESIILKAP